MPNSYSSPSTDTLGLSDDDISLSSSSIQFNIQETERAMENANRIGDFRYAGRLQAKLNRLRGIQRRQDARTMSAPQVATVPESSPYAAVDRSVNSHLRGDATTQSTRAGYSAIGELSEGPIGEAGNMFHQTAMTEAAIGADLMGNRDLQDQFYSLAQTGRDDLNNWVAQGQERHSISPGHNASADTLGKGLAVGAEALVSRGLGRFGPVGAFGWNGLDIASSSQSVQDFTDGMMNSLHQGFLKKTLPKSGADAMDFYQHAKEFGVDENVLDFIMNPFDRSER